jgi:hypothetical protein
MERTVVANSGKLSPKKLTCLANRNLWYENIANNINLWQENIANNITLFFTSVTKASMCSDLQGQRRESTLLSQQKLKQLLQRSSNKVETQNSWFIQLYVVVKRQDSMFLVYISYICQTALKS